MLDNQRHADSTGSGPSLTISVIGALLAFALIISLALLTEELYELDEHLQAQLSASTDSEEAAALPGARAAEGVAVYVPVYGQMLSGSGQALALETLVSIRNTDPATSLQVDAAQAFDHEGRQVARLLSSPRALGPMQRLQLHTQTGTRSTAAADKGIDSLVIQWSADATINRPLIEALVTGEGGISFISRGKTIERH